MRLRGRSNRIENTMCLLIMFVRLGWCHVNPSQDNAFWNNQPEQKSTLCKQNQTHNTVWSCINSLKDEPSPAYVRAFSSDVKDHTVNS